jgi:hypothetical protein
MGLRLQTLTLVLLASTPLALLGQISDTTPPQLVSLSIAPTAVDVTLAAATVGITTRVTDDLSGVQFVCAALRSPSGTQTTNTNCVGRTSGTALDGTYLVNLSIPRFSAAGTWNPDSLQLRDNAGNFLFLTTANLQSRGFSTGVSVTSTTPDTQAPTLTSLNFITPAVDVSSGGQNVVLTVGIADNLSGVDLTRFVGFRMVLTSPSGLQNQYIAMQDFIPTAGNNLNGTYQITHLMPAFSEAGLWRISSLVLVDLAGNQVFLTTAAIQSAGMPTTFVVLDTNADTAAPQITSLAFTPPVFDTSAAAQDVTVTVGLTDNLAGLDFSPDNPQASFEHGITFRSPSGAQTNSCCFFPPTFRLVSGTIRNGIWTAPVRFPQFSEAGTWLASFTFLKDGAQNRVSLTSADLALQGLPTGLTVFRPSQTPDGTIGPAGGTIVDQVFGSRATITFPPNALSQNTTVAIDVLTTPLPIPVPAGFGSPTLFVSITLIPAPSFPLPAPGLALTIPLPAFVAPATSLTLFRFDAVNGGIVPAVSVTGGNVIGTVNADGLSARFTGVSHLSTVVAFIPNANRVLGDVNGDGRVDCSDLALVRASFGKRAGTPGFDARADVNNDGVVDLRDLTVVARQLPPGTVCQ